MSGRESDAWVLDAHLPRQAARPSVEAAAGLLIDAQGRLLLTSRPPGKVYAGYWEFPGGKIEAGESVWQALRRELQEEIGVDIGPDVGPDSGAEPSPAWCLQLDYPHASVRLHVCCIRRWSGALHMHEGQQYAWQTLPPQVQPLLPGTLPLLQTLQQEPGRLRRRA